MKTSKKTVMKNKIKENNRWKGWTRSGLIERIEELENGIENPLVKAKSRLGLPTKQWELQ